MTIREDMRAACEHTVKAFERRCGGRVRLTKEHLAMDRNGMLAEARIGCCQKCGCLEATAEIVEEDGVHYVEARSSVSPSVIALGDRVEPEPDVPARRKR